MFAAAENLYEAVKDKIPPEGPVVVILNGDDRHERIKYLAKLAEKRDHLNGIFFGYFGIFINIEKLMERVVTHT